MPSAPARKMGTWKLAYADFLTALLAFFLVMWLVKGVPETGRAELAGYFRGEAGASAVTETMPAEHEAARRLAARLRGGALLRRHGDHVRVMAVGDRVRIDLMDRTAEPVFARGESALTPAGEALVAELADLLNAGNWPFAIEGHTDAFPARGDSWTNWELSSARALAARRLLEAQGVDPQRVTAVAGLAERQPLRPGEPHLAANRRVTIVLQAAAQPGM